METLIIGKPKIEKLDNRARLCSKISENGKPSYTLWFDVDAKYADYLTESADAFVVALLPYAMNNSLNISAEAKMSKQLCFQLNEIFIPVLTKNSKLFNKISISAKELTQENYCCKNASATGFSRGVDSFDTICNLSENRTEKLSHLTFFNVGSHRSTANYTPEQSAELYENRLEIAKKSAKIFDMPLIDINSNLGEHLTLPYVKIHHYCSFSAVLCMQKFFKNYYYASGYPISSFSIKQCDTGSAHYEAFTASMLSTESTDFYITGLEKTRLEKVDFISKFPITYDNLNVCYYGENNCGHCEKCIRTQFELMALGKLELYKNVFDIPKFYRDKNKYMNYVLKHQNNDYYAEILSLMKKKGFKLTPIQKIKKAVYAIYLKFRGN